jgi:hypothetical protein
VPLDACTQHTHPRVVHGRFTAAGEISVADT